MKPCPHCQTVSPVEHRLCQQCGKPFAALEDATLRYAGPPIRTKASPYRAVAVADLFAPKKRLVIGRAPDCDVVLPHPTVSCYHALLEETPEGLRLRDLASINGVYVDGRAIGEPCLVPERVRIGVGPYLFTLKDGIIHSLDSSGSLRLEARRLEKGAPAARQTAEAQAELRRLARPKRCRPIRGRGRSRPKLMRLVQLRRRGQAVEIGPPLPFPAQPAWCSQPLLIVCH